jgi:hypothetical protein
LWLIKKKPWHLLFKYVYHRIPVKSQTRRKAGAESHGSQMGGDSRVAWKGNPVFFFKGSNWFGSIGKGKSQVDDEAFQGKTDQVLVKPIPLGAGIARSPMIDKLAGDWEMR